MASRGGRRSSSAPLGKEHKDGQERSEEGDVGGEGYCVLCGPVREIGRLNEAASTSTLDKSRAGPALNLRVDSGAPLKVNSSSKVANLNADRVDGRDAPLWAVVAADGTGIRGAGFILESSFRPNPQNAPGEYIVGFDRDISNCSYTATIFQNGPGIVPEGSSIETDTMGPNGTTRLAVHTFDKTGNQAARAFHVQVIC